jgi:hypothetical protein
MFSWHSDTLWKVIVLLRKDLYGKDQFNAGSWQLADGRWAATGKEGHLIEMGFVGVAREKSRLPQDQLSEVFDPARQAGD